MCIILNNTFHSCDRRWRKMFPPPWKRFCWARFALSYSTFTSFSFPFPVSYISTGSRGSFLNRYGLHWNSFLTCCTVRTKKKCNQNNSEQWVNITKADRTSFQRNLYGYCLMERSQWIPPNIYWMCNAYPRGVTLWMLTKSQVMVL